tara:strand:- start:251 stop:361 length:111 start_codon:yes stop_codon:yes gene_type:complete
VTNSTGTGALPGTDKEFAMGVDLVGERFEFYDEVEF